MKPKNAPKNRQTILIVLLGITLVLAGMTALYQGWYVLIRMVILLPLLDFVLLKGKIAQIGATVFTVLGSAVFGLLMIIWSPYPIRMALQALQIESIIAEDWCRGLAIALVGIYTVLFLLNRVGVLKTNVPVVIVFLLVEAFAIALATANFIWRATITIELTSYVTFYAAMALLSHQRSAVILN